MLRHAMFLLLFFGASVHGADRPNVVLFVADDLGWTDLACFGSGYYRTPNLDQLAGDGMKFTAAYACPNCAPTRATLMSGLYPPRHGVYTVGSGARGKAQFRKLEPAPNRTTLAPSYVTLAETMKAAGYATAHFGKWHLGEPGEAGPRDQGFDHNVGGNHSGHPKSYFSPYKNKQLADGPKGENLTDRMGTEAADWIARQKGKPFFVYLPFYAVHTPIQAKKDLAAAYAQRKAAGKHNHPKYAAMVETMDAAVGRVLGAVDQIGARDNTLVIFISDNGGLGGYADAGIPGGQEITHQAPLRGGKGMLYEGGVRVPMVVRWPGTVKPGSQCGTPVGVVDFYPTLCEVAGAAPPKQLDGESLVPLFKNPSAGLKRRALYWHFPGYLQAKGDGSSWRTTPAGAIRTDRWKLLEFFEDGRIELYDLSNDIGESKNLAESNPAKRDELHGMLRAWRQSTQAPMPTRKD